jgi:hypothetical protein
LHTGAPTSFGLDGAPVAPFAEIAIPVTMPSAVADLAVKLPAVPAERAAPAQALPPSIAAPIPARSVPTIVVPAVSTPAPDILDVFGERNLIERGSDPVRVTEGSGARCAERQRASDEQRCRRTDESGTHVRPPFVAISDSNISTPYSFGGNFGERITNRPEERVKKTGSERKTGPIGAL